MAQASIPGLNPFDIYYTVTLFYIFLRIAYFYKDFYQKLSAKDLIGCLNW